MIGTFKSKTKVLGGLNRLFLTFKQFCSEYDRNVVCYTEDGDEENHNFGLFCRVQYWCFVWNNNGYGSIESHCTGNVVAYLTGTEDQECSDFTGNLASTVW